MMEKIIELIPPYGNRLIDLRVPSERIQELTEHANRLPSIRLSDRSLHDLELLTCGAFSPLDRFMGEEDYLRSVEEMRLRSGHLFPIPVTLPVDDSEEVRLDQEVALRSPKNELLGFMRIEEIYPWEMGHYARFVLGTEDLRHPFLSEMHQRGKLHISGELHVFQLPKHYDFTQLRLEPRQVRARLEAMGHRNVIAFQTRNPLHRVHEEMTKHAIEELDGCLLLHPVVGMTKPGDVDHYTRVRTYRALAANHYDTNRILLALLPLAMRLAGPREALWHALIRRNYGANHLIVGRDHASPGRDSQGEPFYKPYTAQELVQAHSHELGVRPVTFGEWVYLPSENRYADSSRVPEGERVERISGSEVRENYLNQGQRLPVWMTRAEVATILQDAYPARTKQGFCVWFTGLSGAGKSTTAEILTIYLLEAGRQVTLLDGDIVRTHLSKGLGFSKEDRDTNIRRIGFVASEIARHGGVAICAAVSPYRSTRNDVRHMIDGDRFIEVFVDTPLNVCEARDIKGLYEKARRGEIQGFTGIDDPYEDPQHAEIRLNTVENTAEENALKILSYIRDMGFLPS